MSGTRDWTAPGWVPETADVRSAISRSGSRRTTVERFDAWLVKHDREVVRNTLRTLAAAIEAETANVDSVSTRHLIGRLYAAAETNPEGGAVGEVVPLREERCDTKHEGPFRLTSSGNGSSSVHYCTLQQGHGGKHYDGVSGQDWRG